MLLATVYQNWAGDAREEERSQRKAILTALRHCEEVEAFLWPRADRDWLAEQEALQAVPLQEFRDLARRWLNASALPVDQLVLTLAQDLYHDPADLALAHKIAVVLRGLSASHPEWRLRDLAEELTNIARNRQRFAGFSEDDVSFAPKPGRVTVTTMHKAKGLEWDRVYLVGVNNYDFPSVEPHDAYRGERAFIRSGLNLEAEVIAQLEALDDADPRKVSNYVAGKATQDARIEYTEERLRLLYVGITRAKKELVVTWNVGGFENAPKQAAAPFLALYTWMESNTQSLPPAKK